MTRIINLRQARKSRARDAKRAEGQANAARFGEAKPLRAAREAEAHRAARVLDAHRTEHVPAPDEPAPQGVQADPGPEARRPDTDRPNGPDPARRMPDGRAPLPPPGGVEGPGDGDPDRPAHAGRDGAPGGTP